MTAEPLNRGRLVDQLILHEGLRTRLYRCTSGKLTIGVGYNVDDRGVAAIARILMRPISLQTLHDGGLARDKCLLLLDADITYFEGQVRSAFPLYERLNDPRKRAVLDFVFNLGVTRAAKFKQAIDALAHAIQQPKDRIRQAFFHEAAWHVMDSLWARQVDDGLAGTYGRADRIADMIRTGKDYDR